MNGLCNECKADCKVRTSGTIECSGFKPDFSKDCIITNYQTKLESVKT